MADERAVSEVVEVLGLWGGCGEVVWGAVERVKGYMVAGRGG